MVLSYAKIKENLPKLESNDIGNLCMTSPENL